MSPPTRNPHVDQSPDGAVRRVRFHLPDEADELLKGRVRILKCVLPPTSTFLSYGNVRREEG